MRALGTSPTEAQLFPRRPGRFRRGIRVDVAPVAELPPLPRSHVLPDNGVPDSAERTQLRARLESLEQRLAVLEGSVRRFRWLRTHRPELFEERTS
jgi:hypothetical protein